MSLFKSTPIRSKAITQAAKGQACTLEIPGACLYGTETTVPCHSPLPEDRNGTKSSDLAVAFGCMGCHDVADRRAKVNGGFISDDDQRYYIHRGIMRTQARLVEMGIVTVKK